jgi:hypothetical protein
MKTKFNNSELSHVWANQTQTHGKGSNMFFEHETIYSYGYHFIIAKYVTNKEGQKCIFLNQRSYSNSTNKQQSLVWRSIPENVTFYRVVSFFNDINTSLTAHKENLNHYINEAEKLQDLTIRANKLKMGYLNQLDSQIDIFNKYVLFFGLQDLEQFTSDSLHGLSLKERYETLVKWAKEYINSEELKKWQIKDKEKQRLAEIKAKEEAKEKIELFRQFKISSIYANLGHYLLRYNKDTQMIETSGGVKMSGLVFIKAYNRLINNELTKGQHVGDFVYNGIENEIVSVGCHKIPMTEINNVLSYLP